MLVWYFKVAEKYEVKVAEDSVYILDGLEGNKVKYGARYCPCKLDKVSENICPCKTFREKKECHCGLFKE